MWTPINQDLNGSPSTSKHTLYFLTQSVNNWDLFKAICESRCIKTDFEIELMRESVRITCEAHKYVMKHSEPGMCEFKFRELFKLYCGLQGTTKLAYECICGAGENGATLHYIVDDAEATDGKIILNDMGCIANGYCADVTCSFPVNGKFTEKQAEIYNAVLKSNLESMAMVKPGVVYSEIHKHSYKVVTEELIKLGLITADLDKAMELVNLSKK